MKKILSIISLFLFGIVFSQNKKFKVFKSHTQIIYNVDFKADSTLSTKSDDMLTLYIGDNKSIFQNDKKYKIDSIIDSQPFFQMSSRPMFKVSHVIKKDYQQSDLIYSDKIEDINFGYKENSPLMQWKLTDEKKNVLTYECYKAEATFRGRKFIAWYTKDIPIADGPYKFAGLPGLILEVYDDQDNFHYKLLAITRKSQNILYDENINFIDRKKMTEARMNVIKKFTKGNIKINPIEKN